MKVLLSMLMALMLSACLAAPVTAQPAPPPEDGMEAEDFDAPMPPPPPGSREAMREQYRRQMQERMRQQQGGPEGRGARPDRGGRFSREPVEPDELIGFLHEHEPKLAERLIALREDDPRAFMQQVQQVSRLYQPVMRQMQYDPEIGKISLQRIRTDLQIEDIMQEYGKATTDADKAAVRKKLETVLTEQFNVVISQQELFIKRGESRAEEMQANQGEGDDDREDSDNDQRGRVRGRDRGRDGAGFGGDGPRDGMGMGRRSMGWGRGPGGPENLQARIEEQKKAIEYWKGNRDVIVKERVGALLEDKRPFPW